MTNQFDDPRWDTFGLLKESFLAVEAAMLLDLDMSEQSIPAELRDLLIRLARSPQHSLRPGALSKDLCVSPSSMTRMIDHAESLALIQRTPDPEDRRAYLVTLTKNGLREMTSWASTSLESSVTHTSAHLTKSETKTLESLLRKIRNNAQGYIEDRRSEQAHDTT